jgi:hypothetical protein
MRRYSFFFVLLAACGADADPQYATPCEEAALLVTNCTYTCDGAYAQCAVGSPDGYCLAQKDPYDDSNNYVFCVDSIRTGIM